MIKCPASKTKPSLDYDPTNPLKGGCSGSQGFVSWDDCCECQHHQGTNNETLQIQCGHNPDGIVTLDSISL